MDVIRKFIPGVFNIIGVFFKKYSMLSDNLFPKALNIIGESQKPFIKLIILSEPIRRILYFTRKIILFIS